MTYWESPKILPRVPHRTSTPFFKLIDVKQLKVGDYIDHRGRDGKYMLGIIIDIQNTNVKIDYFNGYIQWDDYNRNIRIFPFFFSSKNGKKKKNRQNSCVY